MKLRSALIFVLIAAVVVPHAAARAETPEAVTQYTVQRGDTLWDLAVRYGVSVGRLLAHNPRLDPNLWLYPGESLGIPLHLGHTPSLVNPFLYTVQPGESLGQIAWRFEIDIAALRRANDLRRTASVVDAGTTLLVPAGPHYHRLEADERLADVAALYGVTEDYLLRFNNTGILAGRDLFIPVQFDRPFTPMGQAASQSDGGAENAQAVPAKNQQVSNQIADQGGVLDFRWFGVNSVRPDSAAGKVHLVLVAEFRGGTPSYALSMGGLTIPVRGPFLKQDSGQQWSDLEFDWVINCREAVVVTGTLSSADGQTAYMANGIGPFECE